MIRAAMSEPSERADAFAAVLEQYPPDGYADLILCDLSARAGVSEIADAALDRHLRVDPSVRSNSASASLWQRCAEGALGPPLTCSMATSTPASPRPNDTASHGPTL